MDVTQLYPPTRVELPISFHLKGVERSPKIGACVRMTTKKCRYVYMYIYIYTIYHIMQSLWGFQENPSRTQGLMHPKWRNLRNGGPKNQPAGTFQKTMGEWMNLSELQHLWFGRFWGLAPNLRKEITPPNRSPTIFPSYAGCPDPRRCKVPRCFSIKCSSMGSWVRRSGLWVILRTWDDISAANVVYYIK